MQALLNILGVIIIFLVLTGGINQNFSSPEVFAVLYLLITVVAYRYKKITQIKEMGLLGRLWTLEHKKADLYFFIFMMSLLFVVHCLRYLSLHVHGYDVSFVHQPLFFPFWKGVLLKSDAAINPSVLGDHLVFTFLLLTPLTAVAKSPFIIFFLQILIPALLLWALIKKTLLKNHKDLVVYALIIIFSHKGLRAGLLFDFRENVLAMAGLLGMIYALFNKKIVLYFLFLFLALLSKENIFAVTLFFIFPILFSKSIEWSPKQRKTLVLTTAVVSLLYGVMAFKYILPTFSLAPKAHPIFARYAQFGTTPFEIALNLMTSPRAWWEILKVTFSPTDFKYLLFLFGPFAFFLRSKESWLWVLVALPGILMNIAHDYTPQTMMIFHYELIILPGLITGFVMGLKKVKDRKLIFWGILIALCFSGRWPGYFITQNIPTVEQFEIYKTLNALQPPQVPAVNFRFSAQVNHLPEYCLYERMNTSPLCKKVNVWVIDHEQPQEKALADELFKKGCKHLNPKLQQATVWILSCPS